MSGSTKAPTRAPEIVALPEVAELPVRDQASPHHARVQELVDRLAGELVLAHVVGRRVLDLGHGAPRITTWVGERAARLEVVEADELGPMHEALPFPDASFDVVYCLRTLAHLGHDDESSRAATRSTLHEVARVLAPHGAAFVQIENARPGSWVTRGHRTAEPSAVQPFTRTDTLAELIAMLPPTLDVDRVHALAVLASPALLRLPLVGPLVERWEWWARDRPLLRTLGAEILAIVRRVQP